MEQPHHFLLLEPEVSTFSTHEKSRLWRHGKRMPFAESTMWKDIERYFLNARTLVWINPRAIKRYIGFIPDVVICPLREDGKVELTAVEVKRTINQSNFNTALGQCVRFRRFATNIYLAAHEPIPEGVTDELSVVAGEIGVLSINNVGGVNVVREPTRIEQTNASLIETIYHVLHLRTTRWGPSVDRWKRRRMFRCLFCYKLFDLRRGKCPHCGSSVEDMIRMIDHG